MPEKEIANLDPKSVYKYCDNCKDYWTIRRDIKLCQRCGKEYTKTVRLGKDGKSVEEVK